MPTTSIEEVLAAKLAAVSGITTLSGSRHYTVNAPQDAAMPFIIHWLIQGGALNAATDTPATPTRTFGLTATRRHTLPPAGWRRRSRRT